MTPWKILVVDDEEGIHGITRMIFRDYMFEQRPIELISAMSSLEAQEKLQQHPDISLILLDVVMESENAGLHLVEHIRHHLHNTDVRIILRTGHPGYAPEAQVIIRYDINDYLSKAELSASRLLTSVIVALRSYRDIQQARQQAKPSPVEPSPEPALLAAAVPRLKQQLNSALKQGQRLCQLDLNPVATSLVQDIQAYHARLSNSIRLLALEPLPVDLETQTKHKPSPVVASRLMNDILDVFLPLSRQEGWLLDYRLAPELSDILMIDQALVKTLLMTGIELALLQAKGEDIKITLQHGDSPQQLQLHIEQSSGQPVLDRSPWAQHLRQKLHQLTQQLQGRFIEIDEGGVICCQIQLAD
ncbi:response regulator [Oceanospirillum maris]|jgi:CheY-like chemotaxis protein|uniref:response regulator n=1 Tax=Oceanospirillum maris TaxID=64977 RepID=UPI00041DC0D9|nr:response regulator [Oceanospirillum maris]